MSATYFPSSSPLLPSHIDDVCLGMLALAWQHMGMSTQWSDLNPGHHPSYQGKNTNMTYFTSAATAHWDGAAKSILCM